MRRTDREKDRAFALEIVDRCEYGVLSMVTEDGEPYGVPLSVVRMGDNVYFHCAQKGVKADCLRAHDRVSMVCVGHVSSAAEEFSTFFESAVLSGCASEVTDEAERERALYALCLKYTPGIMERFPSEYARSRAVTAVWKVTIQSITGKAKVPKREQT